MLLPSFSPIIAYIPLILASMTAAKAPLFSGMKPSSEHTVIIGMFHAKARFFATVTPTRIPVYDPGPIATVIAVISFLWSFALSRDFFIETRIFFEWLYPCGRNVEEMILLSSATATMLCSVVVSIIRFFISLSLLSIKS